jgi:hypothetical protein
MRRKKCWLSCSCWRGWNGHAFPIAVVVTIYWRLLPFLTSRLFTYPGGGAYIVARQLGGTAGANAGAALFTDYILLVAGSFVGSGANCLGFSISAPYRVHLAVFLVLTIMV